MSEESVRTTQMKRLVEQLRDWGMVDAHQMLLKFGITRLARDISILRRKFGWEIETIRGGFGEMATYRLLNPSVDWDAPTRRAARKPVACMTCGAPSEDTKALTRVSPSFLRGTCATCGKTRMFS